MFPLYIQNSALRLVALIFTPFRVHGDFDEFHTNSMHQKQNIEGNGCIFLCVLFLPVKIWPILGTTHVDGFIFWSELAWNLSKSIPRLLFGRVEVMEMGCSGESPIFSFVFAQYRG